MKFDLLHLILLLLCYRGREPQPAPTLPHPCIPLWLHALNGNSRRLSPG